MRFQLEITIFFVEKLTKIDQKTHYSALRKRINHTYEITNLNFKPKTQLNPQIQ